MSEQELSGEEVRERALSGSGMVVVRGMAIRVLGFAGSLALARLLTPHDFGLVALGTAFLTVANFLSAGGLGGALIRRREPPQRIELEALMGLQLAASVAIVVMAAAAAIAVGGKGGEVVAVMVASLPFLVVRTPGAILLERDLSYRPLVAVEVSETLGFYVFAVALVAAGLGVWGFAAAYPFRSAVGSAAMLVVVRAGRVRPRLAYRVVKGLLGFGLQYQAPGLLLLGYEQALNSGGAAIGGTSTLGLFSFGRQLWSVPGLIYDALSRVSFPAMSRLVGAGEDPAPLVERAIARLATLTGLLYVGFLGVAPPLVTVLFGQRWAPVADVFPLVCLATVIAGPVSVACGGYLYAAGDAAAVTRSAIATSIGDVGLTLGLLSTGMGVVAYGCGRVAGSIADAIVLGRASAKHSGAAIFRPQLLPGAISIGAGGAGWLAARAVGTGFGAAAVGFVVGEGLLLGGLLVARRELLADTVKVIRKAVAASLARKRAAAPVPAAAAAEIEIAAGIPS